MLYYRQVGHQAEQGHVPAVKPEEPPAFLCKGLVLSVLSIHIDESGNLNLSNRQNPTYCLTMVFHNQDDDISTEISVLDEKLENIGWNETFIHTMPLIRQDEPYAAFLREERIKIFTTFAAFVSALPIGYKTFFVTKTFYQNESQMEEAFVHQISSFINDKLEYFQHFDKIIIYYDRGQKIINSYLHSVAKSWMTI